MKELDNVEVYHNAYIFLCIQEIYFMGKFRPKNKRCLFKFKFVTKTNKNVENSMTMLFYSVLDQRNFCGANFVQKHKYLFKLKLSS